MEPDAQATGDLDQLRGQWLSRLDENLEQEASPARSSTTSPGGTARLPKLLKAAVSATPP
jgi:hypothetical protein